LKIREFKLKIKWLAIFIIIAGVRLYAQNLQDWRTITYMNDVTDMVYANGEIWVSTTGGAYQFNIEDSTYKTFTNIEGLGSLDLSSIDTDDYGTVIAGSRDGLINRYNRDIGLWTFYDNLKGEVIVDLYTNDDTLWVASNTGVGVFLLSEDDMEFRDYYYNLPLSVSKAFGITVFNHRIFYATENGLLYASSDFVKNNLKISEAWTVLNQDNNLPSNLIYDIVHSGDSLLVGTEGGAASIDNNLEVTEISSWTNGIVRKILSTGSDIYFIRIGDYFKQLGSSWILLGAENIRISSGIIDSNSNMWVGMNRGGIKKSGWDHALYIDGPAGKRIGGVIKDRKGTLWCSSGKFKIAQNRGFYKYNFQNWTNFKFYDNEWERKNYVVTVYEDLTGKIWYGSWGGGVSIMDEDDIDYYHGWSGDGRFEISTIDSKDEMIVSEPEAERSSCFAPVSVGVDNYLVVPYFLEDDFGNLWSTNHGASDGKFIAVIPKDENGNLKLDCNNWIYFGRNIGFTDNEGQVSALEFDDFNRVWVATFATGILVFDYNGTIDNRTDDKPLIRVNTSSYPSLFSNTVLSLKSDKDGIIWIGTAGGLNSFDGQNFFRHVGDIGPIENKINAIFVDKFNNKWFATDGGLSILKADESPWDPRAWVHYSPENSGLPDKIVNSIFVDQTVGEAYIGTESGLSIFSGSFAELKEEMNSVVSGPSPYILDNGSDFVIKNLVFGASVKILNINGKLVRILSREEGNIEGGRATWDGRDQSRTKVSSGIYIYLVYNEEGITASGKIAVINP
jgi:ligand-binding sensor domain-containing protein